jgi:hypothetical protein
VKIRMIAQRTGPRYDGRPWPGPGGEINVPDEEGRALCAQGDAVPVAQPDVDVEKRHDPPPAPPAPEPPASGKPAVNAPKADWVAYAESKGLASADADAMTKEQLVKRFG